MNAKQVEAKQAEELEIRRRAQEERQNADEIVEWGGEFWGGVGAASSSSNLNLNAGAGLGTVITPAPAVAAAMLAGVSMVAADASALMMAALAVQAGLEAGAEPTAVGAVEVEHNDDHDDDDLLAEDLDNGLEDMLPVEDAIGEDDMMDAVMQALVGDGAGDTEEDEEPVTQ
jgi:hypothetical protein